MWPLKNRVMSTCPKIREALLKAMVRSLLQERDRREQRAEELHVENAAPATGTGAIQEVVLRSARGSSSVPGRPVHSCC